MHPALFTQHPFTAQGLYFGLQLVGSLVLIFIWNGNEIKALQNLVLLYACV